MGGRFGRWLRFLAPAAIVVLMTVLVGDALSRPRTDGMWDGPAMLLFPAVFYTGLVLLLLSLNLDLGPSAPSKDDLAHLLILKRHGSLPIRSRRTSASWPRRRGFQT